MEREGGSCPPMGEPSIHLVSCIVIVYSVECGVHAGRLVALVGPSQTAILILQGRYRILYLENGLDTAVSAVSGGCPDPRYSRQQIQRTEGEG